MKNKRQWCIERDSLPKPSHKGQKITGLHCACSQCTETHAYVIADYVEFEKGNPILVWLDKSPCVEQITRQVLRAL